MEHVITALIGLVGALIAWKLPALGDQGAQQAALAIVTFILGWLRRSPLHPTDPPAAVG